jgi:hypothetical protein
MTDKKPGLSAVNSRTSDDDTTLIEAKPACPALQA